jgi:hypothetical protein
MSDALGGNVRFVIDTSHNREGRGKGQSISDRGVTEGLGLGHVSTGSTNLDRVDMFLWLKNPGESDGSAATRGNPNAGQWFSSGRALGWPRTPILMGFARPAAAARVGLRLRSRAGGAFKALSAGKARASPGSAWSFPGRLGTGSRSAETATEVAGGAYRRCSPRVAAA